MKARIFTMFTLGLKMMRRPYYQGFAAQVAFFYVLSIVPTLILISQALLAFFRTDIEDAVGWLLDGLTGTFAEQIKGFLTYRSAGAVNILYAVVALWAASRAQFSLTRISIYTITDGKETGGYWTERFRSLFTMFLTIFAMAAVVVLLIYGAKLLQLVQGGNVVWLWIRWPIVFALFVAVLLVMYRVMPPKRVTGKQVLPGAIFAAVGLVIVTFFYAVYVNVIAHYDIVYGTLAGIAALLFWFYFVAWVMALGMLFNKVIWETGADDPANPYQHY